MKIGWLSDGDLQGSGYHNLTTRYCTGLAEAGHEVKVVGLRYDGKEHRYPFSMIPTNDIRESLGIIQNLTNLWQMDLLIVALDLTLQEEFLQVMKGRPFKYMGIFPIESDPLCMSWAMVISQMDKAMIISKFGTNLAREFGLENVGYLEVGIDLSQWQPLTQDEKNKVREMLGFKRDAFVMLTVADNQERKNLWASIDVFASLVKKYPEKDLRYVLVTREHNQAGYKLRDMGQDYGINNRFMMLERGISPAELRDIYGASDVFVLPSKAEGLGMPLLEAMAMGLICFGTHCTGIEELLTDHRGILIPPEYVPRDPFGNQRRYWISRSILGEQLEWVMNDAGQIYESKLKENVQKFLQARSWDVGCKALDEAVKSLFPVKEAEDVKAESKES